MDDNIMELFSKVSLILHKLQYHGGREDGGERAKFQAPHRGQGRVLGILKIQPEISQKDLSYLLDMSNQSLSELLSKLERAGYITRTKSETDRRVMNIRLTATGVEAANEADEQKRSGEDFFDCLSTEERTGLVLYLNKIITAYETQSGGKLEFGGRGRGGERHGGFSPDMILPHEHHFFGDPESDRRSFRGRKNDNR